MGEFPRAPAIRFNRSVSDAVGTGLGLGLSIVRKAVRAHGGDITIRNMPGTGCVFVIDLPLVPDAMPVADLVAQ